ncbi:rRNA methyltransferase 1, mitochondrial [Cytospora mali]|uniref:rRNA methyltransferase 1, mitochondrial n=1 Tax=Cytospora mali TaxID=578113 RepID=A0A194V6S4_CYTMA|nr:rRNA methyltransferase 1, mitochondrial [Valsa mali var. pyri (nom. inval.)]
MRPQGPKEIRIRPGEDEYLSPEERRRQRALARRNPITYKIRKGKKDITEEPGPPRKSKAARFADPRDPFGKRSLVKKFKTGELFAQLEGQGQGRRGGKVQQGETDGHLQHDDFVRQMMGGDLGNHSDSRKKESFGRSSGAPHGGRSKAPAWGEKDRGDRGDRRAPSEGYGKSLPWGEKDRGDRGDRRAPSEEYGKPSAWGEKDRSDRRDRYASSEGYKKPSSWGSKDRGDRYAPVEGGDRDMFDLSSRESRRAPESPAYDESRIPSSRSSYRPERTRPDEPSPDSSYGSNRPSRSNKSDEVDEDGEADEAWVRKPKRQEVPVSLPYATAASQFLYGTSTVEAALQANRRKLYRLYIYKGKDRRNKSLEKDMAIGDLAKRRGLKVEYVDEAALPMLNKMSGSRPHNGHILEASPLPQMPVRALGELTDTEGGPGFRISPGHQSYEEAEVNGTSQFVPLDPDLRKPLVLMVDEVLDPGNLGAILRTASFMGVTAVAVSKRGSAPITPVVLKASAGAAETLTMFSVESVEGFLKDSRRQGWKVYAAVAPTHGSARRQVDTMDIEKEDPLLNNPCILLVGNEGEGLSRALRRASDIEVSIPNLSGATIVDSLNVSVATGLLCSAFLRGKAKSFGDSVHVVKDAGAIF